MSVYNKIFPSAAREKKPLVPRVMLNVSDSLNFDISPNLSVPLFIVLSQDLTEKDKRCFKKTSIVSCVLFSPTYPFEILKFHTKRRTLTIRISSLWSL